MRTRYRDWVWIPTETWTGPSMMYCLLREGEGVSDVGDGVSGWLGEGGRLRLVDRLPRSSASMLLGGLLLLLLW